MEVKLKPGKYVVAVSGGVDSVVLLDLLSKHKDLDLVVAHVDHGLRVDSSEDRQLVETLSQKYNYPFEYTELKLAKKIDEDTARQKRYGFLRQILNKYKAQAILVAHHSDDVLETAVFNILRGSGRQGLDPFSRNLEVIRPLKGYSKHQIKDYAIKNKLSWREDSTNQDQAYTRNWIRLSLLPKLSKKDKEKLLSSTRRAKQINQEVESFINSYLKTESNGLNIKRLSNMPHEIAAEVLAEWLRQNGIRDFTKVQLNSIITKAKTLPSGKRISLNKDYEVLINGQSLLLVNTAGVNKKRRTV